MKIDHATIPELRAPLNACMARAHVGHLSNF